MKKTIIAVHAGMNEGKTSTIKQLSRNFRDNYVNCAIIPLVPNTEIDYSNNHVDILVTVKFPKVTIGIGSQGDPKTGTEKRLEDLVASGCDIIVCATRTRGETVHAVNRVASRNGYHVVWFSNFSSNTDSNGKKLEKRVLNRLSADGIENLIKALMIEQL